MLTGWLLDVKKGSWKDRCGIYWEGKSVGGVYLGQGGGDGRPELSENTFIYLFGCAGS